MNSDLVMMTFSGTETAEIVYGALRAMRNSQVLGLGDVAILTSDGSGQISVNEGFQASTGVAGLLADRVLCSPKMSASAGDGLKLDVEFVETLIAELRGGGSALVLFLHSDGLGDTRELLSALALFRGTIHQTTLSPGSEALV